MSILNTKLFRDIKLNKLQFTAVIIIVALGISFYIGLIYSYNNLRYSIDKPYEDLNFADIWLSTSYISTSNYSSILDSIDGVREYELRLIVEAPAMFETRPGEFSTAKIISVPAPDKPRINDLLVVDGEYLDGVSNEVLVEKSFAAHHNLSIGDTVYIKVGETLKPFRVSGIVISPEYLWPAKSILEHMPDVLRRWGVMYMSQKVMYKTFGLDGFANEAVIKIDESINIDSIIQALDNAFSEYGVKEIVPRELQPSNNIISLMVDSLRSLAIGIPIFFLTVSAIATYIVLSRLIRMQTRNIGLLIALGYSRRDILLHYLEYSLLIGVLGSAIGIVLGLAISMPVTEIFATQVNLPLIYRDFYPEYILYSIVLSLGFTSFAGIIPSLKASRMSPAESMRYLGIDIGGIPRFRGLGLLNRLPNLWRIPYRNMFRRWSRTIYTIIGIALSFSMIVVPISFYDSMDYSVNDFFGKVQVYDVKAYFSKPYNANIVEDINGWNEVSKAEPFIEMYVRASAEDNEWTIVLRGIVDDSSLYGLNTIVADDGREGILLSRAFYSSTDLSIGDKITLDLKPVYSEYWRKMNETYNDLKGLVTENITVLINQVRTMREDLILAYHLLGDIKGNLSITSKIFFGIPYAYVSTWIEVLGEVSTSPSDTVDVYLVNDMVYQFMASNVSSFANQSGVEASLALDYLSMYHQAWNSSFPSRYYNVSTLLYSPSPFERGEYVLDETITILMSSQALTPDLLSMLKYEHMYLNITNWSDEALINDVAIELFKELSPQPPPDDIITSLVEAQPQQLDKVISDIIRSELSEMVPEGYSKYLDEVIRYAFDTSSDIEGLVRLITDDLMREIIASHPPPLKEYTAEIKGFVDDPAGLVMYLPINVVQNITSMNGLVTGVFIDVKDGYPVDEVKRKIYGEYEILYTETTEETRRDWQNMLQLYTGFIDIITLFGVIISSTIIFNTLSINLRERIKEYATMRTLGFKIREIIGILGIEHFIMVVIGSIVGVPISIYASRYFLGLYNSEFFSFDTVIYSTTYLFAVSVLIGVLFLTLATAVVSIKRIDLPRIIKESSI